MVMDQGLAVYNLHDRHQNDVVVCAGKISRTLTPGRNVMLTDVSIDQFAQVNPLQCIGFRNMRMRDSGGGIREFTSEFSIVSALKGIKLLQELAQSENPSNKRIVADLAKTAASIMQTKGNGVVYRRMTGFRYRLTAQR